MNFTIANTSTTINDVAFANAIAAINLQVSRDFQPIWNVAATIAGTKFALDGSPAAVNTPTDAIIYLGDRFGRPNDRCRQCVRLSLSEFPDTSRTDSSI